MAPAIFHQLSALTRKDLTIRRRSWCVTLLEILLPILIAWLAVKLSVQTESTDSDGRNPSVPPFHFPYLINTNIADNIYYTPSTKKIQEIINYLEKSTLATVKFRASERDIVSSLNSSDDLGLVFSESNPASNFTIRLVPNLVGPPRSLKSDRLDYLFWWLTFSKVVWHLNRFEVDINDTNPDEGPFLDTFSRKDSPETDTRNVGLKVILGGIVLGNIIIVVLAAKRVAIEKTRGSKELLRMMGVADYTYWLAQFLNYLHIFIIQAIVIAWITFNKVSSINGITFFGYLLMIFVLLWSNLMIALTVSTVINRPILVQVSVLSFLMSGLILVLQSDSGTTPGIGSMFFSPSCLFLTWLVGSHTETSIWINLLFIPCWFSFGMLTLYFDAVCPWQPGTPKRWNFFLLRGRSENRFCSMGDENSQDSHLENGSPGKASIICSDVYKVYSSFGSKKLAVEHLSLEILQNQITVLLGHNGAGKTTLMSMITGFTSTTSGRIHVNGFDVQSNTLAARRSLALCPQHECLYENLTTRENLQLCANLRGNDSTIIASALDLLRLGDKSSVLASKLSGGMRRRLQLAMALVTDADTIILDEPTSGLDPETRRTVWDYLLSLRHKKTILISTHFMEEADALADQIVIMSGGRIKCVGSPMYLKTKLGAGYLVKMVKRGFNRDVFEQHIFELYPGALKANETSEEVCYNLNVEDREQQDANFLDRLASFCDLLDKKKEEIGISSYTITTATLEDVFMKIAVDDGIVSQDRVTFSQVRENTLAELSGALDYQKGSTVRSAMQGFRGLLCKRFHYTRRDLQYILYSLIIPCTIVFFLGWAITVDDSQMSQVTHFPAREMTPDLYYQDYSNLKIIFSGPTGSSFEKCCLRVKNTTRLDVIFTNSNLSDYIQESGIQPEEFDSQYLFGIEGGRQKLTIFFSGSFSYSYPIAFITYMDILRCTHPKRNLIAPRLTVIEHPIPQSPSLDEFLYLSMMKRMSFLFLIPVALAFVFSSYYIFPSKELSTKARLIQHMTGFSDPLFWVSDLVFDAVYHSSISFLLVMVLLSRMPDLLFSIDILATILLLFIVAGLTGICLAYLLTFTKISPSSGFNILSIFFSLSGAISSIYLNLSLALPSVRDFFPTLLRFQPLMKIVPPIGLTSGLGKILEVSQITQACPSMREIFQQSMNQSDRSLFDLSRIKKYCLDGVQPNYLEIIFPEILSLLCPALAFFILTLILSSISHKVCKYLSSIMYKIVTPTDDHETISDGDVVKEKEHVEHLVLNNELSNEALLVHNITKDYFSWKFTRFSAAHNVTFRVHKRECFGLLGVNGAGKTTTFSMLTGDIPMSCGDAYVGRLHVLKNLEEYRKNISYCPQVDALLDLLTPEETLTLFGRLRGIPEKDIPKNVGFIIDSTDLTKFRKTLNGNLSGGNKRKLGLAIAAIGGPSVIFLDEPTTGVDPASRRKIWATLIGLRESGRSSIVLTSHSMDECEALCNRIAIMANGQIQCLGSSTHLKNKYGQGYTLIIKTKDDTAFSSIHKLILDHFACAKLQDHHGATLQYHLDDPNLRWAHMFRKMKLIQDQCPIESFYINDTSIEQIFLSFAQTKSTTEKGHLNSN